MHTAGRGRLQPNSEILKLLRLYLFSAIVAPTIRSMPFVAYRNRYAGAWNTVIKKYPSPCRVVYSVRAAKLRPRVAPGGNPGSYGFRTNPAANVANRKHPFGNALLLQRNAA